MSGKESTNVDHDLLEFLAVTSGIDASSAHSASSRTQATASESARVAATTATVVLKTTHLFQHSIKHSLSSELCEALGFC